MTLCYDQPKLHQHTWLRAETDQYYSILYPCRIVPSITHTVLFHTVEFFHPRLKGLQLIIIYSSMWTQYLNINKDVGSCGRTSFNVLHILSTQHFCNTLFSARTEHVLLYSVFWLWPFFPFFTETLKPYLLTTESCKFQFLMPDTILGKRTMVPF